MAQTTRPPHNSISEGYRSVHPQTHAIEKEKKRLVVIGVACLTLIVFTMWVWNMRVSLYTLTTFNELKPSLLDEAKNDFQEALAQVEGQPNDFSDVIEPHGEDILSINDTIRSTLEQLLTTSSSTTNTTSTD